MTPWVRPRTSRVQFSITEEPGRLLGFLTTDGSNRPGQSIKFTNTRAAHLDQVSRLVSSITGVFAERHAKGTGFDLLFTTSKARHGDRMIDLMRAIRWDERRPNDVFALSEVSRQLQENSIGFDRPMVRMSGLLPPEHLTRHAGIVCGIVQALCKACGSGLNGARFRSYSSPTIQKTAADRGNATAVGLGTKNATGTGRQTPSAVTSPPLTGLFPCPGSMMIVRSR
jgi:hypothetical protein